MIENQEVNITTSAPLTDHLEEISLVQQDIPFKFDKHSNAPSPLLHLRDSQKQPFSFYPLTATSVVYSKNSISKQIASLCSDEYENACVSFLNQLYELLKAGKNIEKVLDDLYAGLYEFRIKCEDSQWVVLKEAILSHPIKEIIHLDRCTAHSFNRPRGYPGDALLLDYFYGFKDLDLNLENLSDRILRYTINRPSGKAVRERTKVIAERIDAISAKINKPRILSLACGHLREAGFSAAVMKDQVGEYVAFDHDIRSLDSINKAYIYNTNIQTVQGSVLNLIAGKKEDLGEFDFVYASGLYDYLSLKMAIRLTTYMFNKLRPGGTLLITNFLPNIPDIGYMESFMNWDLIYRDISDMNMIFQSLPAHKVKCQHLYKGDNNTVIYLEVEKMG